MEIPLLLLFLDYCENLNCESLLLEIECIRLADNGARTFRYPFENQAEDRLWK